MHLKQFSLIFLFPALILAFPAESDVDVRGLFAKDVLCKQYIDHLIYNGGKDSKINWENAEISLKKFEINSFQAQTHQANHYLTVNLVQLLKDENVLVRMNAWIYRKLY